MTTYNRDYYQKNKIKILASSKKYREKNKEKVREMIDDWNIKHPERIKEYERTRYKKHKKKRNAATLKRYRSRYSKDTNFRLANIIRLRIRKAVVKQYRTSSSKELLGCTIQEVREYLASKFQPGMSWENHGEWHIDHILPCSSFDLTKVSEQKRCFHYTNLQPLWAADNLSKGCSIKKVAESIDTPLQVH